MNEDRKDKPLNTALIAAPAAEAPPPHPDRGPATAPRHPLLPEDALQDLRRRWTEIQSRFVDEPRRAVEHADSLVAEHMMRLAESFASERARLENQWSRNQEVDTEELRLALQRYRSFFERLLEV